jgi:hypothetical protein
LARVRASSSFLGAFEQVRSARRRATLRRRLAGIAVSLVRWFMRRARLMRVPGQDREPDDAPLWAVAPEATSADRREELVLLIHWRAPHDRWERSHPVDVDDGGGTGAGAVGVDMRSLARHRQAPERRRCRQSRADLSERGGGPLGRRARARAQRRACWR